MFHIDFDRTNPVIAIEIPRDADFNPLYLLLQTDRFQCVILGIGVITLQYTGHIASIRHIADIGKRALVVILLHHPCRFMTL